MAFLPCVASTRVVAASVLLAGILSSILHEVIVVDVVAAVVGIGSVQVAKNTLSVLSDAGIFINPDPGPVF